MSEQRYDLYRLYLANMEQFQVAKRVYAMVIILLGIISIGYFALFQKDYSVLWLIVVFLLFLYFILGNVFVGAMAFGPPDRVIKKVAKQKLKKPEDNNAGELAATAALLIRNGNVPLAKDLLDQVFQLRGVSPRRLMFANTVLSEALLVEGELDEALKTLKGNALKKSGDAGSYTFFILGRILLQQEDYDKAIQAFEDAAQHLTDGYTGVPDMFKQGAKNRSMISTYGETLQVFVPYYLGKTHLFAPKGDKAVAQHQLDSALVLCRNRYFKPLLKQDFGEKD